MSLFERFNPWDRVYLTQIEDNEELLAENRSRMLLCDARGVLTVGDIETSIYKEMLGWIEQLSENGRSCASLCLERGGEKVSYVIEIDQAQATALDSLLYAFYETKKVPEYLVPHLAEIIRLGRQKTSLLGRLKGQAEGIYPIRPDGEGASPVAL
jgi:hypothetical protein